MYHTDAKKVLLEERKLTEYAQPDADNHGDGDGELESDVASPARAHSECSPWLLARVLPIPHATPSQAGPYSAEQAHPSAWGGHR